MRKEHESSGKVKKTGLSLELVLELFANEQNRVFNGYRSPMRVQDICEGF